MLFKKLSYIFSGIILGLIFFLLLIFINLPFIVESQIAKRIPMVFSTADIDFDIQKIGFRNTFISKVRFGKGLSIDSINIDYRIKGFSSIHIDAVTISGLKVIAMVDENNHVKLQGLDIPQAAGGGSKKSYNNLLSMLPKIVVLKNCRFVLHKGNHDFQIPFDIMSTLKLQDHKIMAHILFYPFGENISTKIVYDINRGIELVSVEGASLDVNHMYQLLPGAAQKFQLNGLVDFKAVSSAPLKKWEIMVSNLNMNKPFQNRIDDLTAMVFLDNQEVRVEGTMDLTAHKIPPVQLSYGVMVDMKNGLVFGLNLKNAPLKSMNIKQGFISANAANPEISANLNGTFEKAKGRIHLTVGKGRVHHKAETVNFSKLDLNADIAADFTKKGQGISSRFTIDAKNIQAKSDEIDSLLPKVSVSGKLKLNKSFEPSGHAVLSLSDGRITSDKSKINASGLSVTLPFQYPEPTAGTTGKYEMPVFSYDNKHTLRLKGSILQTKAREFKLDGVIDNTSFPQVSTQFTCTAGVNKTGYADIDFSTNSFQIMTQDIQKLIPGHKLTADIDMTARIEGKAEFGDKQTATAAVISIQNGSVTAPDLNLTVSGINSTIELNDLLVPESIPGQMLIIDMIEAKKIKIQDARIRFSLEDAASLLIENVQAKWCNGRISTESLRVFKDKKDYAFALYCDQLDMAQLMEQMELLHAKGTGTLSGRIPIAYSGGNISFDNGFLFSTSGSGGELKIEDTEKIISASGIPMHDPGFVQVDLAQEALKDFRYKWAKLIFNTFEDELSLNISINGKPNKNIPFIPLENGKLIRVDASSPGSELEGLQLDLNLNLPFKEMMKFGNKLESIFN